MSEPAIVFTVPIRTVSEANSHEHYRKRQKRAKEQRLTARMHAHAAAGIKRIQLPCVVRLTRIAPRKLDKFENLPASMKHIADGLCDWLEVDDGADELIEFTCGPQERGAYAVRVEVFDLARVSTVIVEAVPANDVGAVGKRRMVR